MKTSKSRLTSSGEGGGILQAGQTFSVSSFQLEKMRFMFILEVLKNLKFKI